MFAMKNTGCCLFSLYFVIDPSDMYTPSRINRLANRRKSNVPDCILQFTSCIYDNKCRERDTCTGKPGSHHSLVTQARDINCIYSGQSEIIGKPGSRWYKIFKSGDNRINFEDSP